MISLFAFIWVKLLSINFEAMLDCYFFPTDHKQESFKENVLAFIIDNFLCSRHLINPLAEVVSTAAGRQSVLASLSLSKEH